MIKVILIFLFFVLLGFWDVPKLISEKRKKELTIYIFLALIGFIFGIMAAFHVSV
ncbi:hypothetical protein [Scopulibacillus cellulosilyticus]|uniref:Uncharacterized protein n=1 Tax=Scopulibacillus cellulosilyticus TaxID=2665665 RepID=A0ABW2PRM6_9BACL